MKFSKFGQKFTRKTGILQLMDDLGNALAGSEPVLMLGGGNPARLPEVNAAYERVMRGLLDSQAAVESVGNYSTPQGDAGLIDALADFLRQEYGWHITRDNIALTNGSQNAFFYLFNLFGGAFEVSSNTASILKRWKTCPNGKRAKSARFAAHAPPTPPATC